MMKQIFDWLREQMEARKDDAETRMYRLIDEDRGNRCVYSETDVEEFSTNTWADALSILDEAEAKWEAEGIPIIHGKAELELHDKAVRAKAIEEFAEKVKKMAYDKDYNVWTKDTMISIWESTIDEIAEQLKGE